MRILPAITVALLFNMASASAQGLFDPYIGGSQTKGSAQTLKVDESVEIDAPLDDVWRTVSDFNGSGVWIPVIKESVLIKDKNNIVGAVRHLTYADNSANGVEEELLTYDPVKKITRTKIIDGVFPMTEFIAQITVSPTQDPGVTKVNWKSEFKRRDRFKLPAKGQDDATAQTVVEDFFKAGLQSLKAKVESR